MSERMVVEYFHEIPGLGYGNIMWRGKFPMRGGRFPANHPVGGGGFDRDMQAGGGDRMEAFRDRGYWASCFPEGDGITMKTERGQDTEQVVKDIVEVFGWRVQVRRDDRESARLASPRPESEPDDG